MSKYLTICVSTAVASVEPASVPLVFLSSLVPAELLWMNACTGFLQVRYSSWQPSKDCINDGLGWPTREWHLFTLTSEAMNRTLLLRLWYEVQSIACSMSMYFCLSVCPLAYLRNHMSKFHETFCTSYLWPWLGPSLTTVTTVQYAKYFRFGSWRRVSTESKTTLCFVAFARWHCLRLHGCLWMENAAYDHVLQTTDFTRSALIYYLLKKA